MASVAMGTSFAAESPQNSNSPGKSKIPVYDEWDVIVVGGGPSGCAAATAAAREGAKTLLIEGTGALGGMGTSGLLNAWCPFTDGEKIIYKALNPQLHSRSATYIKRNGLLIRKITIKSSRPFQCAYHPLTP